MCPLLRPSPWHQRAPLSLEVFMLVLARICSLAFVGPSVRLSAPSRPGSADAVMLFGRADGASKVSSPREDGTQPPPPVVAPPPWLPPPPPPSPSPPSHQPPLPRRFPGIEHAQPDALGPERQGRLPGAQGPTRLGSGSGSGLGLGLGSGSGLDFQTCRAGPHARTHCGAAATHRLHRCPSLEGGEQAALMEQAAYLRHATPHSMPMPMAMCTFSHHAWNNRTGVQAAWGEGVVGGWGEGTAPLPMSTQAFVNEMITTVTVAQAATYARAYAHVHAQAHTHAHAHTHTHAHAYRASCYACACACACACA
jgi:hypothetical protein